MADIQIQPIIQEVINSVPAPTEAKTEPAVDIYKQPNVEDNEKMFYEQYISTETLVGIILMIIVAIIVIVFAGPSASTGIVSSFKNKRQDNTISVPLQ